MLVSLHLLHSIQLKVAPLLLQFAWYFLCDAPYAPDDKQSLYIGDSNLVNGETAEYARVVDMNRQLAAQGKDLVVYQRLLMGIT
jgi:hypothetical protein